MRAYGKDQSVFDVTLNLNISLNLLRMYGYKIDTQSRFQLFKNKFNSHYISSILNKQYSVKDSIKRELLYGYKDYWELLTISQSRNILAATDSGIRNEIKHVFSGSILEGKDSRPWDYQFQYHLSSLFELSGLKVTLQEPDFSFEYKGRKYTVAAKRLNSKNSIQANIEKAENQIKQFDNYGFIALSLDKIFKETNPIVRITNPESSLRKAKEIIQNIIREDFLESYFGRRTNQILGIIACISFPYFLESEKPLFELGYTSTIMFLPIQPPDTAEWNEVLEIGEKLQNFKIHISR
ncbi:hypothetical protein [Paenibacillus arenosi]|uniref:Uncharacterized protein n=1 Tax=Paenibacillus arenosi TaxID=2774142 RepID=A0ABR9ASA1_9BACL|nr:hypothetical protein [Paenibacillus arenosi]MBD8496902.1 hypothetical protein [Paenibacillus arenosi]